MYDLWGSIPVSHEDWALYYTFLLCSQTHEKKREFVDFYSGKTHVFRHKIKKSSYFQMIEIMDTLRKFEFESSQDVFSLVVQLDTDILHRSLCKLI